MRWLRPEQPSRLVLGPEAAWFRRPGGSTIVIDRRKHLRRLLVALVQRRAQAPGTVLPVTEMFQAGWPGDRAFPKAAATRVYTAIHALRALGLAEMLVRRSGGYVLEADVQWAHDSEVPLPMANDSDEVLVVAS